MFYLCCIESRPEQFEAFFLDKSSQWIYLDSQGQERARRLHQNKHRKILQLVSHGYKICIGM